MLHANSAYMEQELLRLKEQKIELKDISSLVRQNLLTHWSDVTSAETFYNRFGHDIDTYFAGIPVVDRSTEIDLLMNEFSSSSMLKYYYFNKENATDSGAAWPWIERLLKCLNVHTKAAGEFYQLLNKCNLCHEGMAAVERFVKSVNTDNGLIDFNELSLSLKDCLSMLINLNDIAEEIFKSYLKIRPISHRTKQTKPVEAKLLVSCCFDDVELSENETVIVIDKDFETNLWTVEKIDNNSLEKYSLKIPSLFLSLEGCEGKAVDNCSEIKIRLKRVWNAFINLFQKCLNKSVNELSSLDYLNSNALKEDLKCLSLVIEGDEAEFDKCSENFIDRHKENQVDGENEEQITVPLIELLQFYKIAKTYKNYFQDLLNESSYEEKEMVVENEEFRYVSMAYLSSVSETVDMDQSISYFGDNAASDEEDEIFTDGIARPSESLPRLSQSLAQTSFATSYVHESRQSISQNQITLLKPSSFLVIPTYSEQFKFELVTLENEEENWCFLLIRSSNQDVLIIGIKNSDSDELLKIEHCLGNGLIDLDKQTYRKSFEQQTEMSLQKAFEIGLLIPVNLTKEIQSVITKHDLETDIKDLFHLKDFQIIGFVKIGDLDFDKVEKIESRKKTDLCVIHNVENNKYLAVAVDTLINMQNEDMTELTKHLDEIDSKHEDAISLQLYGSLKDTDDLENEELSCSDQEKIVTLTENIEEIKVTEPKSESSITTEMKEINEENHAEVEDIICKSNAQQVELENIERDESVDMEEILVEHEVLNEKRIEVMEIENHIEIDKMIHPDGYLTKPSDADTQIELTPSDVQIEANNTKETLEEPKIVDKFHNFEHGNEDEQTESENEIKPTVEEDGTVAADNLTRKCFILVLLILLIAILTEFRFSFKRLKDYFSDTKER